MAGLKIKKGDTVRVITGKDKGKTGEVFEVSQGTNKAKVKGLNLVKAHTKQTKITEAGIFSKEAFIDISNLSLVDPSTNKPAKVGYKFEDGKKIRVFKPSGNKL